MISELLGAEFWFREITSSCCKRGHKTQRQTLEDSVRTLRIKEQQLWGEKLFLLVYGNNNTSLITAEDQPIKDTSQLRLQEDRQPEKDGTTRRSRPLRRDVRRYYIDKPRKRRPSIDICVVLQRVILTVSRSILGSPFWLRGFHRLELDLTGSSQTSSTLALSCLTHWLRRSLQKLWCHKGHAPMWTTCAHNRYNGWHIHKHRLRHLPTQVCLSQNNKK